MSVKDHIITMLYGAAALAICASAVWIVMNVGFVRHGLEAVAVVAAAIVGLFLIGRLVRSFYHEVIRGRDPDEWGVSSK